MRTILGIILFSLPATVLAWGPTGHRVVGDIAEKHLSVPTSVKVNKLLKGQSLARVSTWADEIKSDPDNYQHTFNWHYTTWESDDPDHSEHDETENTGLLLKAINNQLKVLQDPKASDEEKSFSLKFFIHLIGDVHMPLHVGNGTDHGGNACKVTYMGKPYSLHSVWDEGMIDFTRLSYKEIAAFVLEGRTVAEFQDAQRGSIIDWALESKKIRPMIYPLPVQPTQDLFSSLKYCQDDVMPEEIPALSYEYAYQHMPTLEKRLFQAGIRLAMLLNLYLR